VGGYAGLVAGAVDEPPRLAAKKLDRNGNIWSVAPIR